MAGSGRLAGNRQRGRRKRGRQTVAGAHLSKKGTEGIKSFMALYELKAT